ncbi:hypothetical protein [Micromonospora sonneratiae]|uniref:SH3 domain-containing protein n=1 Tax=Micromonospora sonneratiae TaxID=1184706 RepID=A0ABW3Y9W8_9ACTN
MNSMEAPPELQPARPHRRRLVHTAIGFSAVLLSFTAGLIGMHTASADQSRSVTGTVMAQPTANLRDSPQGNTVGTAAYGDRLTVACYAEGPGLVEGWGGSSRYWDRVTDSNGNKVGWIADVWLDTGGEINTQVDTCDQQPTSDATNGTTDNSENSGIVTLRRPAPQDEPTRPWQAEEALATGKACVFYNHWGSLPGLDATGNTQPIGHVAFAFQVSTTGLWLLGSGDNDSVTYPNGTFNDKPGNGVWIMRSYTVDEVVRIFFEDRGYESMKCRDVTNAKPRAATEKVLNNRVWTKTGNNCLDHTYRALEAYGVDWTFALPVTPKFWFDEVLAWEGFGWHKVPNPPVQLW